MDDMDMNSEQNAVRLVGRALGEPQYSHSSRGQAFYRLPLLVGRLSGNADAPILLLRQEQLAALPKDGEKLLVEGELRSFNNRRGEGPRLVITVLARQLSPCAEPDSNRVLLRGALCKPPKLRLTPLGRDICDLMLAVNRRYGRSDYLPCICWGALAREAARWDVGDKLLLRGRFQSRDYIKLTELGPVEKTAYEVSADEVQREISCC